jgi:hypothetical protein
MAPDFLAAHNHHFPDEIQTGDPDRRIPARRLHGQIRRTGRHIQKSHGLEKAHLPDREPAPGHIAPQAEKPVQEIITSGDCGKNLPDQTDLLRWGKPVNRRVFLPEAFRHVRTFFHLIQQFESFA